MTDTTPVEGTIVKALRKKRGWSQNHLAHYSGVAQATISLWERELIMPSQKLRLKVLVALKPDPSKKETKAPVKRTVKKRTSTKIKPARKADPRAEQKPLLYTKEGHLIPSSLLNPWWRAEPELRLFQAAYGSYLDMPWDPEYFKEVYLAFKVAWREFASRDKFPTAAQRTGHERFVRVLELRWFTDGDRPLPLSQVGARMGQIHSPKTKLSPERVRQMEARGLRGLRYHMRTHFKRIDRQIDLRATVEGIQELKDA